MNHSFVVTVLEFVEDCKHGHISLLKILEFKIEQKAHDTFTERYIDECAQCESEVCNKRAEGKGFDGEMQHVKSGVHGSPKQ